MSRLATRVPRGRAVAGASLLAVVLSGCGVAESRERGADGGAAVAIVGAVRVRTATIRTGALEHTLQATGQLEAWREATLRAEAGGRVVSMAVDSGAVVEAGDVLIKVDGSRQSIAIDAATARVRAVEEDLARAENHDARMRSMATSQSVAQAQVDNAGHDVARAQAAVAGANAELRSARRAASDVVIRAPIAGIVTRRQVDVGDTLVPGTPLLDLVDLSQVRVRVGVSGRDLGRLDPSRPVELTVDDLGGAALPAVRFAAAGASANPVTGLFEVEFHAENPEAQARAGMVATVTMHPTANPNARVVAREAITRRGGQLGVFVLEDGVARFVPVRTGGRDGAVVELLEGPAPGREVAVSALHALADGVGVEVEGVPAP